MLRFLPLALLALSCSHAPSVRGAQRCSVPCLGTVEAATSSCEQVTDSVQRARDLLTAEVVAPMLYCRAFAGVRIVEHRERSWNCRDFAGCEGEYDPATRTIHVGAGLRGLMHELLHHWQTGVLGESSLNHRDWAERGYFRLVDDYLRTHPSQPR